MNKQRVKIIRSVETWPDPPVNIRRRPTGWQTGDHDPDQYVSRDSINRQTLSNESISKIGGSEAGRSGAGLKGARSTPVRPEHGRSVVVVGFARSSTMVFVGRSTAVTESVVFPMRLAFRFMGWTVPIRASPRRFRTLWTNYDCGTDMRRPWSPVAVPRYERGEPKRWCSTRRFAAW